MRFAKKKKHALPHFVLVVLLWTHCSIAVMLPLFGRLDLGDFHRVVFLPAKSQARQAQPMVLHLAHERVSR
jgi:hypothetical protein